LERDFYVQFFEHLKFKRIISDKKKQEDFITVHVNTCFI
jgi:hypothetical protein